MPRQPESVIRHTSAHVLWLVLVMSAAARAIVAAELPAAEKQKIESLLKHVAELKEAKFVRNGSEYDAATAAKFLRGEWETNAKEIRTANEFIEKAASKSSTTGKPYLIRFKDGKEMESGESLKRELKKLESAPAKFPDFDD